MGETSSTAAKGGKATMTKRERERRERERAKKQQPAAGGKKGAIKPAAKPVGSSAKPAGVKKPTTTGAAKK